MIQKRSSFLHFSKMFTRLIAGFVRIELQRKIFGRPFLKRFGLCYRTVALSLPLPQFSALICCGQMAGWIKMPLGMDVGLSPGDFALDGDPAPHPQKGTEPPSFGQCLLWPNGWMDQDGTWHGGGPRSKPHCARCGPSSSPQKGGRGPQFSAHVCCGQTAGWIKMPLGMEIDVRPGDFVLDGDPALTSPKSG